MRNEFIETIKIHDGKILNADMHNARMWHTTERVFGRPIDFDVRSITVPENYSSGVVKCRMLYDMCVKEIAYTTYIPRRVSSLALVDGGGIDYSLKYADRACFDALLLSRGLCDDILITVNGCITDTSYSNVVFVNDDGMFAPDTFLLDGTKRRWLLQNGVITERRITVGDLCGYSYLLLVNAMLGIEDDVRVDVNNICF